MSKQVNFKRSIPVGARAGVVSGCSCTANPRQGGGHSGGLGIARNPAPQARAGVRYGGRFSGSSSSNAPVCYMGTNGQMVCPRGGMNMRARGGGGMSRDYIGRDTFRLPGGQFCWQDNGRWYCEDH